VGNAADHVHIVAQHAPQLAVAALVGDLKGASSRAAHVAGIMAYECGWQVGYWAETVGGSHIEPLLEYVTHQRAHHAAATTIEPWRASLYRHESWSALGAK
jgi:REP element-mobilizing transposase RayT